MLTPEYVYDPVTRLLTVTDTTPPVGFDGFYVLYEWPQPVMPQFQGSDTYYFEVGDAISNGVRKKDLRDGSYTYRLARYDTLDPLTGVPTLENADEVSDPYRLLATGQQQERKRSLYISHAASPRPLGQPYRAYLLARSRSYEVSAGYAEGNYLLAHQLLTT